MVVKMLSVEGPDFLKLLRKADEIVSVLEKNNWDFSKAPEIYSRKAAGDVFAKTIVHIFDGSQITRIGSLITGGVGEAFNLLGPIPPNSIFKVTDSSNAIRSIERQIGSGGLNEYEAFRAFKNIQEVEYFNYNIFTNLSDMLRWFILYESGSFPSALEHMKRLFASGHVIQNNVYRPAVPSFDRKNPAIMKVENLYLSFPSKVMEWMDKPLYGGLSTETIHKEYLLTTTPTKVSHPYLPMEREGRVELAGREYHLKEFGGITPKEGVRNKDIPSEGQSYL